MCSIFGIFGLQPGDDLQALRRQSLERSQRQRHRGPDWSGVYLDGGGASEGAILVHERLAIVDPAGGSQPLLSEDGALALAVNGEIYNHVALKRALSQPYAFQTESDCEVINALYREDEPASFLNRLNGIFAFALWDSAKGRAIIARDPMGVVPLYWGHDADGRLRVASEMKSLADEWPSPVVMAQTLPPLTVPLGFTSKTRMWLCSVSLTKSRFSSAEKQRPFGCEKSSASSVSSPLAGLTQ